MYINFAFIGQSIIFGILAATTRRFQCFWTPYICIFAACAIADHDIWWAMVSKIQNLISRSSGANHDPNTATSSGTRNKKKDLETQTAEPGAEISKTYISASILKHVIVIFVIVCLFRSHRDEINKELEDLREFWDPDTVDLMEWINKDVPRTAAFTGSMQLLAGVRLCTWRPITNHPHFEDEDLRDRTREVG